MRGEQETGAWSNLLVSACGISDWNRPTQNWKTNDGKWYSLNETKLEALEKALDLLIEISTLGPDRQWIIAENALDYIKNILTFPEPNDTYIEITTRTWQLLLNLLSRNSENQRRIWNECNGLLLNYLQQDFHNKDTCRLIIFNLLSLGNEAKHESSRILKTVLNSFHCEKQAVPLKEQGLTMLLDYFVVDDNSMLTTYLGLTNIEKVALLHFTIDRMEREDIDDSKCFPISRDLLLCMCYDFNSKCERTFNAAIKSDEQHLQVLFALFEVIAMVSNDKFYKLNSFNFDLVLNVERLLIWISSNVADAEQTFSTVRRKTDLPLKQICLMTITNLMKGNHEHQETARDCGLIDRLVDFIAAQGTDIMIYRHTIFALIAICQTSARNMDYLEKIVKNKEHNGCFAIFANLLVDIKWKGRSERIKEEFYS